MTDNTNFEPTPMDEALARFADQMLSGKAMPDPADDPELADLQGTVAFLSKTMKAERPDAAFQQRMRANLAAEWQQTMKPVTAAAVRPAQPAPMRRVPVKQPEPNFWQKLLGIKPGQWQSNRRSQQSFSFAMASLAVVVLVALVSFNLVDPSTTVVGAVQLDNRSVAIIALLIGIVLGIVAWTRMRGKK